jgi:hypothetical protein
VIYDVANKLLGLVANELTGLGILVPERQYLAPGSDVVFDCEQLTVRIARVIPGMQGADTTFPVVTHSKLRKTAELFVTIVRCVPTMHDNGDPPTVDEYMASSQITFADAFALRVALENIEHQHLLVPVNVPCTVGQLNTLGPLGGLAACDMMFSVELVSNPTGWVG